VKAITIRDRGVFLVKCRKSPIRWSVVVLSRLGFKLPILTTQRQTRAKQLHDRSPAPGSAIRIGPRLDRPLSVALIR
jgi:hypothetical protein